MTRHGRHVPLTVVVVVGVVGAGAAHGQCGDILWCDGFEHYARGVSPIGQDCAIPSECDPVSCAPDCCPDDLSWQTFMKEPRSADALIARDPIQGDNVMCVDAPDPGQGIVDDMVHTFHGLELDPGGAYDFAVDVLVPEAFAEGPPEDVWVILLNQFEPNGDNNWSTQVHFNSTTQMVVSDFDEGAVPFETDAWGVLRVSIDFTANTQRITWNDELIVEKSWTEGVSGGGIRDLQAVDVFAGTTAVALYFDNFRVVQAGGQGTCEATRCFGDLDASDDVGFADLLLLLNAWGPSDDCPPYRPEDLDASCDVGFGDLLLLLSAWGPCG